MFLSTFKFPAVATLSKTEIKQEIKSKENENERLDDLYIIGPGDVVFLQIYSMPELNSTVKILKDNTSSFPLIGNITLEGLTVKQAENKLSNLYKSELIDPRIRLQVNVSRPIKIAILGEVERPGLYTLTTQEDSKVSGKESTSSGMPTVVDALKKAGGITPKANLSQVIIKRRLPGIRRQYKQAKLNILSLLKDGDMNQNPMLFDGDIIKVTPTNFLAEEISELAATNLAPDTIKVNVIGEVQSPGLAELQSNSVLSEAIMAAGGVKTWRANNANVELIRFRRNGSISRKRFNLKLSKDASNDTNPPLRNRDVIYVKTTKFGNTADAISNISTPLSGLINIWALVKLSD